MGSKVDVWAKKGAYDCHFPMNIWKRGLKSIFSPAPWKKGVSNIYIFPSALKKGGLYRGTYPSPLHNEYPPPPGFDVKRNNSQILNSMNSNTLLYVLCKQIQIDVLVQERRNSSALALELRLIHRNVVLAVIVVALRAQLHLSRANCVSRKRRGITAEDEAHIPVTAKMHLDWSRACKNQPVVWLVRPICRQNTLIDTI